MKAFPLTSPPPSDYNGASEYPAGGGVGGLGGPGVGGLGPGPELQQHPKQQDPSSYPHVPALAQLQSQSHPPLALQ